MLIPQSHNARLIRAQVGAFHAPAPVHPVPGALLVLESAFTPRGRQSERAAAVRERGARRTGHVSARILPVSQPPFTRMSSFAMNHFTKLQSYTLLQEKGERRGSRSLLATSRMCSIASADASAASSTPISLVATRASKLDVPAATTSSSFTSSSSYSTLPIVRTITLAR